MKLKSITKNIWKIDRISKVIEDLKNTDQLDLVDIVLPITEKRVFTTTAGFSIYS